MIDLDLILYSERMVGKDSPDYSDTLNRALLQVIDESGADPDAFVGFALRPTVAPTVGQFYRATDTDVGAAWTTLTAAMISDLTTAATGITKLGTVNTGVWQGTSIDTAYTDAKIKTVTGTVNRLSIGGTATDPVFDISSSYVGQATITTLGTVTTGVWNATSIGTAYTDAKVVSLSGVSNRTTITGTATVPIVDISATYVGQTSITTLGTIAAGVWNGTVIGTAYTTAQVVSLSGTASRITVGGTATVPTVDISAAYIGQTSITTLGTITAGTWNGSVIGVAYTTAQLVSLTGTLNRITIGGTSTAPTVDVSTSYVGQATITTLGTIATGTWQGTSIATTYTDAKVKTVTGTANRLTIGGTATDPTFDIAATYVGQASITTLGTIATGTWAATTISVDKGGTGLTSYAIGDLVYASGATTLSKLAVGTAGAVPSGQRRRDSSPVAHAGYRRHHRPDDSDDGHHEGRHGDDGRLECRHHQWHLRRHGRQQRVEHDHTRRQPCHRRRVQLDADDVGRDERDAADDGNAGEHGSHFAGFADLCRRRVRNLGRLHGRDDGRVLVDALDVPAYHHRHGVPHHPGRDVAVAQEQREQRRQPDHCRRWRHHRPLDHRRRDDHQRHDGDVHEPGRHALDRCPAERNIDGRARVAACDVAR
jgi:hypothetical protein